MRKVLYSILVMVAIVLPQSLRAVIAIPQPIEVSQPDGSVITIHLYGDEFLHWRECGGRLVAKGEDGFYHYAEFSKEGVSIPGIERVKSSALTRRQFLAPSQRPPLSAIHSANAKKELRRRAAADSRISIGERPFLVLLVNFSDLSFRSATPQEDYSNLLNQVGYSANDATGSVFDYYHENSSGLFTPRYEVAGPYTVSKSYSYYGADDNRVPEMVAEAARLADADIDFSRYDIDGDGYVDNVFVYFAGHGEADSGEEDCIWPHAWAIYSQTVMLDGVRIFGYATSNEVRGTVHSGGRPTAIGTFTHEFGHVLGLPDFYDTDGNTNGSSSGLSYYSLMDGGCYSNDSNTPPYLNAEERMMLGWMDEGLTELTEDGVYTLTPVTENLVYTTPTNNPGEYFVYEYRKKSGWDAYIPKAGMLIYHVDKSNNDVGGSSAGSRWSNGYGINEHADHQCMDLVEAKWPETSLSSTSQIPFPGSTGNTSFTDSSSPSATGWDGSATGYNLTEIAENGETASFRLTIDHSVTIIGVVTNKNNETIEGAHVTITQRDLSEIPANAKIRSAAIRQTSENTQTATSDANGAFNLRFEKNGEFCLQVSHEGYSDYMYTFTATSGSKRINVVMQTPLDEATAELIKYSPDNYSGGTFGTGANPITFDAGVIFFQNELSSYVGYVIKTVSFLFKCSDVERVEVLVELNGVNVLTREVPDPLLGEMNHVDISDAGIMIPENADVLIGYRLVNANNGYPIAVDDGPYVTGGGYWWDGSAWTSIDTYNLNYNILISASVMNFFPGSGYNAIVSTKEKYTSGDTFTFALTESANTPIEVAWTFDEEEKSEGESVTLTAGTHIVKATLTYAEKTETIIQEILVE